jgi:putative ABC transport system permease protein
VSEAWRLARRDLRGGLGGLGLLWLCLAIAVAAIASVTSIASSIDSAIASNGRNLIGGDLVVRSAQHDASPRELAALTAQGRASKSVTLRAMAVAPGGKIGLAELSSIDAAWPLAGRLDLAPGGTRPTGREVAVGRELAERLDLKRGSAVRVGYARFTVSGIIDKMPAMSGFAFSPPILVDEAGLAATGLVQPGSLTTISYRLILPPGRDPQAVGKAFQARFPDGGWSVTDRNDAGQGTRRFVERVAEMLLLVALAALAIGGLGIASAAAAFAASRRATVATLKLLGAGRQVEAGAKQQPRRAGVGRGRGHGRRGAARGAPGADRAPGGSTARPVTAIDSPPIRRCDETLPGQARSILPRGSDDDVGDSNLERPAHDA